MTITQREIDCANGLFWDGWCGSDPYGPTKYMTDDVVMRDIAKHEAIVGHEAIANRWRHVAGRMRLPIEELFVNEHGIVVLWFVYVQIADGEHAGKWAIGEGMSRLEFRDGKVCLEIDYWHGRQGMCDSWDEHFAARRALPRAARGFVSGAWVPGQPTGVS